MTQPALEHCARALNRPWHALLLAVFSALLLPGVAFSDIVVIVNAANTAELDDGAIARIYLAQVRKFPDGGEAVAIEQSENSAIRNEFSDLLVKRAPAHIKSYWAQQKFTGNLKQLKQINGDDAVLKFVAENRNAIGYIDASKIRPGVKIVARY